MAISWPVGLVAPLQPLLIADTAGPISPRLPTTKGLGGAVATLVGIGIADGPGVGGGVVGGGVVGVDAGLSV